jgi:DNA-binding beta-propeller fold protein YncE
VTSVLSTGPEGKPVVNIVDKLYHVERPWGSFPVNGQLHDPGHIAVDSHDRVYVFQRSTPPVVVFDASGTFLKSWGSELISDAHGIFITHDDQIWLVDRDAHQVMRFTPGAHLTMELGNRHRPSFQEPFNHPTGVAVSADGKIYVADGYGNSRVHCFSSNGELEFSWGRPGTLPGEFTTPHAVWVDKENRVLVADRENNRIQVFTHEGLYLTEWRDFYHPMGIYQDQEGKIYVTDQIPRLSVLAADGTLIGRCRPVLYGAHDVWGDSKGNLYLSELTPTHRITKLSPIV